MVSGHTGKRQHKREEHSAEHTAGGGAILPEPAKKIVFLLGVVLLAAKASGKTMVVGMWGQTYPIAEEDAVEAIKKRAAEIDWSRVLDRKRIKEKLKHYQPPNVVHLPAASENGTYEVDMTYVLPFDVKDAEGRVIYPKGYRFNPLDYVFFPNIIVVINFADKRQVEWFEKSRFSRDHRVMLLITDGSWWDAVERFKRPVYYLTEPVASRFKLKAVPCVVYQKGRVMEVRVYAVH